MKKIVAVFAVVLLLSCSKDDDGSLPITHENLAGLWNFKSVVKDDGTVVPYVGRCATQKDYIDMYAAGYLAEKYFFEDCTNLYTRFVEFTFDENYKINTISSFLYKDAIIKNMTRTSFTIEFPEPRTASFEYFYVTNSKAVVFERRQN